MLSARDVRVATPPGKGSVGEDAAINLTARAVREGVFLDGHARLRQWVPGSRWYSVGMRVAIDGVGRLVIPKALRDELGVHGPTDLELTASNGRLELTVADVPAHVEEQGGFPVIVTERPLGPLSVAEARAAVERVRR
ncbi:MAG TPA: hypothetical protein VGL57_09245 [Solirubrobacteraceae bacterium]